MTSDAPHSASPGSAQAAAGDTAAKKKKSKKPAAGKKKDTGRKPSAKKPAETSKSDEVRKLATSMKAKGEKPRPSVIVAELKKQGIDVAPAQVSIVLKKMGFRPLRKRKGAARAGTGKAAAAKAGQKKASVVSLEDLLAAKKVAGSLGGTDKAIAALQALKKFED